MRLPLIAASALLSTAALAPLAAQIASADPAAVQAGNYKVETWHTRVLFSVDHFGFNRYFGSFSDVAGTLAIDPKHPELSKVDVTVPIASINTTNSHLDTELKSADWFGAEQFPTARFVSTSVTPTGKGTARIDGTLTLHGVTKPISLEAQLGGSGANPMTKAVTAGFSAKGTIRRSDFGVSKYVPVVGDEVELTISAAFEKAV